MKTEYMKKSKCQNKQNLMLTSFLLLFRPLGFLKTSGRLMGCISPTFGPNPTDWSRVVTEWLIGGHEYQGDDHVSVPFFLLRFFFSSFVVVLTNFNCEREVFPNIPSQEYPEKSS